VSRSFRHSVKEQIEDCLYVDDLITGTSTVEQGVELYQRAKGIMKEPTKEESHSKSCTGLLHPTNEGEHSKLLGVTWNSHTDQLLFKFEELIDYASSSVPTDKVIHFENILILWDFLDPLSSG